MNCTVDKIISGTPEKKYYLIKFIKSELEKILGREIQIFLLMNKTQQEELFKMPAYMFNTSAFNFGSEPTRETGVPFSFSAPTLPLFNFGVGSTTILPISKGYEPGELSLPYKNFHNFFESLFHMNKNKSFQKEKEQNFSFKMTGGNSETEANEDNSTPETEEEQIDVEKFLFYTMQNDLKIRIVF